MGMGRSLTWLGYLEYAFYEIALCFILSRSSFDRSTLNGSIRERSIDRLTARALLIVLRESLLLLSLGLALSRLDFGGL